MEKTGLNENLLAFCKEAHSQLLVTWHLKLVNLIEEKEVDKDANKNIEKSFCKRNNRS